MMIPILTPGERFWLMSWRRGWTRRELAEMYSPTGPHRPVALSTVDRWFHDKGDVPEVVAGQREPRFHLVGVVSRGGY